MNFSDVYITYEDEQVIKEEETVLNSCPEDTTAILTVKNSSIKATKIFKVKVLRRDGTPFSSKVKRIQKDGSIEALVVCETSYMTRSLCD